MQNATYQPEKQPTTQIKAPGSATSSNGGYDTMLAGSTGSGVSSLMKQPKPTLLGQ